MTQASSSCASRPKTGLGRGDGGPWRARLGHVADPLDDLLRRQLSWAIVHDMRDRVRLLAENGTDVTTPFEAPDGGPSLLGASHARTPAEVAALCGCPAVLDWLTEHGATRPALDGADALIAAALAGDHVTAGWLRDHAGQARAQRPGLIVWAAARRAWDAVPLLAGLGWDVNARGRSDVPVEQEWQTALHQAAADGDLPGARLLLSLGADTSIRDARFDGTPLGWAEHFHQDAMADFLRPLTS
jgi:hypothetical protein